MQSERACKIAASCNFLRMGEKITLVTDGRQAVERFENEPAGTFDAILMDGLTATRAIRALERQDAKAIPIIAMTANVFKEDIEQCIAAGMNAHLAKPLNIEQIKRAVFEQIRRKKQI